VAVEIDEADERRLVEGNSLPRSDFVERVVNVRQMVRGDVANESARDLIVADATMEPAKKYDELHANGKNSSENAVPVSGHEPDLILRRETLPARGAACCAPMKYEKRAGQARPLRRSSEEGRAEARPYKGRRTIWTKQDSEEGAGESAERGAETRADRGKEAVAAARSVVADVQEFSGNAQCAAKEIGVDAEKAGESLQGSHLALKGGVGECQLILLRLIPFRDSLLAREFVGEFAEAGGIARTGNAVLRGLLERIEGTGERALGLIA